MANVLIVAHLLIVIALIAVILIQRSEGGGLGIGGGSGFMTARGSANLLTRTTAILATLFFVTSVSLTLLANFDRTSDSIIDRAVQGSQQTGNASVLDALNQLNGGANSTAPDLNLPTAPANTAAPADTTTPAVPADAAATTPVAPAADTTAPAAVDNTVPANTAAPANTTVPPADTTAPAATPANTTVPAAPATTPANTTTPATAGQ